MFLIKIYYDVEVTSFICINLISNIRCLIYNKVLRSYDNELQCIFLIITILCSLSFKASVLSSNQTCFFFNRMGIFFISRPKILHLLANWGTILGLPLNPSVSYSCGDCGHSGGPYFTHHDAEKRQPI